MTTPTTAPERPREEIELSWRRATMSGLDRATAVGAVGTKEVDPSSALLLGAAPVLEALELSLAGSGYCTVLADRECRVARRWTDDHRTESGLDALGVTLGASLLEDSVGTNALGTALATRHGISVFGEEHYAESLRGFSCYGHPIRHPLTNRIEGVLGISVQADMISFLVQPLISRAVADIELRLFDVSRASEKGLFYAFQVAAASRRQPILAVGEDVQFTNGLANDLLAPADIALIRILAAESSVTSFVDLTLESGTSVRLGIEPIAGPRSAALVRLERTPATASRLTASPTSTPGGAASVLVTGAPGTGRTTRARELTKVRQPFQVMMPALALLEGEAAWAKALEAALRHKRGTICIDGLELLPDRLLSLVADYVSAGTGPALVFTSGPPETLTGHSAAVAGMAIVREELLPLAARKHEIRDIAVSMLKQAAPGRDIYMAPKLLEVLVAQPWPGNLHELKNVVTHLAATHTSGALTVADLPPRYRSVQAAPEMNARYQAERDVIVAALRKHDGNKVKVADELCLSRTTLYARMRTLKIATY